MKNIVSNCYSSYGEYLINCASVLQRYIDKIFNTARGCYEKDKHPDIDKYLYFPLKGNIDNHGKLHRPLTCLAAYLACCNNNLSFLDDTLAVACAIENFQTAALIHDDIADSAAVRRSKPCMYKTEGVGIAVNAGDFGLSLTLGSVINILKKSTFSKEKIFAILDRLVFMEYMTIEGQAMDLGWARDARFDVGENDYICMATKKSAYYSAAIPCVLGGICADASNEKIRALETFGKKVGVAFQIQDDLLNIVDNGEISRVKDFRNDITEGKRTLCVCKTLESANEKDKNTLIEILKSNTTEEKLLNLAVQIMDKYGALEYAKNLSEKMCKEAYKVLDNALEASQWKNILLDMSNWVIERKI